MPKDPIKAIEKLLEKGQKKTTKILAKTFSNLLKPMMNILKGLGKMISNLIRPILTILKGLGKMMANLLKPIMNILKGLMKTIVSLFKKVMGILSKIVNTLKKAFLSIFYYIKCAIDRIKNSPKCMVYYLIDVIFFTLLIPVRLLILIFPVLEEFEEMFRDAIQKIDTIVHRISLSTIGKGFHINKWPDGVLNKCYRCKAKFEDPEDLSEFFAKLFDFNLKGNDNFFLFFAKAVSIISIGFLMYVYSAMLMKPKTCAGKKEP